MADDPITRLNAALEGRYRIERELGEGGMATVYLADDLKHERKVALKVLKPELAAVVGAERFLAEIKTTANLHHPHILPLFDSGEAGSFLFYVMPYVEGETLRERIGRDKQLPVAEAVEIAAAVSHALQHAHDRGVIHRDIKPGNILLQDGQPVVSDFGIALAVGSAGGARLTETGLSVGTPYYMAPEQATGDQNVGPASDTYALGAVLYEMLTGDPPYLGSTAQAVLGQIIAGEAVSATKKRRAVPPNVDAALKKALERLPADRFAAAQDFARALSDPAFRHGEEVGTAGRAVSGRWKALAMVFAATTLTLGVVAGWSLVGSEPASPRARFAIALPDGLQPRRGLAIAPDGGRIVFAASGGDGSIQLYVRELGQLEPTPIPGSRVTSPAVRFSPDGASIVVADRGALRTISLAGAPPLTLSDSVADDYPGIDWGSDGMVYFRKEDQGIWRVPATGGPAEEITSLSSEELAHAWLDLLPSGRGAVFTTVTPPGSRLRRRISVLDLETREIRPLFPGDNAMYSSSGHLVYMAQGGTLFAVPFDGDRLEVSGQPRAVLDGLQVNPTAFSEFDVSETGALVYRRGLSGSEQGTPVWLDRGGAVEVLDPSVSGAIEAVAISPDGRRVAFDRESGNETHIWIYDLAGGTPSRLTFEGTSNRRPAWSPDSRELTFVSNRNGPLALFARAWDGSGTARLLRSPTAGQLFEGLWTPDGSHLLYRQLPEVGIGHLFYAPPEPDSTPVSILDSPFFNVSMSLSSDGRWLAYQSDESGRDEIYVRPFPGPGGRIQVSAEGGTSPAWAPNGREIFYVAADGSWVVAQVRTAPDFGVESRESFGSTQGFATSRLIRRFDVASDGQRLLVLQAVDGFTQAQDVVVQGFFEDLRMLTSN